MCESTLTTAIIIILRKALTDGLGGYFPIILLGKRTGSTKLGKLTPDTTDLRDNNSKSCHKTITIISTKDAKPIGLDEQRRPRGYDIKNESCADKQTPPRG